MKSSAASPAHFFVFFFPRQFLPLICPKNRIAAEVCTTDDLRNSRILVSVRTVETRLDLRDYLFQEGEEGGGDHPRLSSSPARCCAFSAAMFSLFPVKVFRVTCVRVGGGQGHEAHLSHLPVFAGCLSVVVVVVSCHLDLSLQRTKCVSFPLYLFIYFFFFRRSYSSLSLSLSSTRFHPSRKKNVYKRAGACFAFLRGRFADFQGYRQSPRRVCFGAFRNARLIRFDSISAVFCFLLAAVPREI